MAEKRIPKLQPLEPSAYQIEYLRGKGWSYDPEYHTFTKILEVTNIDSVEEEYITKFGYYTDNDGWILE